MQYRFCYGPSGAGKSYRLQEWILKKAGEDLSSFASMEESREPGFDNYLYVVPEQYTMQTQKDLVEKAAHHGIMNVDVLSFGRLSHRIFEETGEDARAALDDVGKSLILRRLATKVRSQLEIIGGRIDSLGMISEVKSQISEFMQYDVSPDKVGELSDFAKSRGQGALAARLRDLKILYEAFLDDEKDRFITGEETYDLLAEAIPKSQLIRNSVIVFDGFTGFTPVQYRVLGALMENAVGVIFGITAGEDGGPAFDTITENTKPSEQDLFYLSRKTMRDIIRIGKERGVPRGEDISLLGENHRFAANPELDHLEQNLFRHPAKQWNAVPEKIHLFAASTQEEEVRQVFIEIGHLVREQGLAYRDIGIVAGDLSVYSDLFTEAASEYGVPVYIDENRAVLLNPLTESIRACLDLAASGFTYETVFRYLRSGLSDLTRDETDRLENYCIEKGIHTTRKWDTPFEDSGMEELRKKFMAEICPIRLTGSHTAKERTQALYQYLVGVRAGEKCAALAEKFAQEGDPVRELEYSQIYRSVLSLLDQIYALLGGEPMSAKDYLKLMETGFAEIRLGVLPQKVDRVLVGDIERSRLSEMKVLFFVGVNDGNIPKGTDKGGLISDLDREFLRAAGTELAPTPREQMYIQRLYLYLNVTKPSEELYLSYAGIRQDGSATRPSYLVPVLQALFPKLVVETPERAPASQQLLGTKDALPYLAGALRAFSEGAYRGEPERENEFFTVYGLLAGQKPEEVKKLTGAAFRTYRPRPLSKETALLLYMRSVTGSVTRLETAAKCSLRQYLQYGLRLSQRQEYFLEPSDTGNVLHDSISAFSAELKKRGLSWNDFTEEQGRTVADEVLGNCAADYHDRLFYDRERNTAALARMRRILHRTVHTLQFQVRSGDFTPTWFEHPFGEDGDFVFDLGDGDRLVLAGRIDRVDLAREGNTIYAKIMDYKSGDLDLDPEKIRKGLQLQLVLYMEAVLGELKKRWPDAEPAPAALLYYRFQDPFLTKKEAVFPEGESSEQIEEARKKTEIGLTKKLRPKGMVTEDPTGLSLLDHTGDSTSLVIPVRRKGDGTFYASTKVFSGEQFEEMMKGVNRTICEMAKDILNGKIDANPRDLGGGRTACSFCPFADVCGFDLRIPGSRYRED